MNSLKKFQFPLIILPIILLLFVVGCKEGDNPGTQGSLALEITDAPVDDAEIQAVFVTVVGVEIDGEEIADFEGKQTINLLAYQNGDVKALGLTDLEAKSYSEISLILDYESDVNGDTPGCYVQTTDGTRHDLATSGESTGKIVVNGVFEVEEEAQSSVVLDVDLRKAITYQSSGSSKYTFVTQGELNSAVRLEDKALTGTIEGSYSGSTGSTEKVVVYAYEKGTFNKSTETQGQGSSNIMFKNAVTSSVVVNNNFTLAFLEEGDYEVCFVAYEDANNDGKLSFQGFLQGSLMIGGSVTSDISVDIGASASLSLQILGIIN